jgi:hypothetical protein
MIPSRRLRYYIAHIGVKLGIIRRYGRLKVEVTRAGTGKKETVYGYNIIVDEGIKQLGDILAAVETTNTSIEYIEPGSGTTTPVIGDTDTETPLTPATRNPVTTQTRNAVSPFDVVVDYFVSSTKYTRPQTINELCIFFEDDPSGTMFARVLLSTAITLNTNDTATISYGVVFR